MKKMHELACLDACDYADFSAERDNEIKSVYFADFDGGTYRVVPFTSPQPCDEWTLIYCTCGYDF